jgi:hydrogenase maturation protease
MAVQFPSQIVVIGVGNIILSDDGVGVHAARLLLVDPRIPARIRILDGGTMGPELVSYASDASHVLLLDAMNFGAPPGTIEHVNGRELLAAKRGSSVHQLAVADLISALFLVAAPTQEIALFGVQPANVDWGTTLSPPVQAALSPLVDAAVVQLQMWHKSLTVHRHEELASLTLETSPRCASLTSRENVGPEGDR